MNTSQDIKDVNGVCEVLWVATTKDITNPLKGLAYVPFFFKLQHSNSIKQSFQISKTKGTGLNLDSDLI